MTITYKGNPLTEKGLYAVRCNGEPTVGEVIDVDDDGPSWMQLGIDFDHWTYGSHKYEIEVISKLDLK